MRWTTHAKATVITAWLLILLCLPAIAALFGNRATNLEGAVPPTLPKFELGRALDTKYYNQVNSWLAFNDPLRDEAIGLNGRIDLNIFHESPHPEVTYGRDGWVYTVGDSILAACKPGSPTPAATRHKATQLRELAATAKIPLFVSITPDKSYVESEHFPTGRFDWDCIKRYNEQMRSEFDTDRPNWIIDNWAAVDGVVKRDGVAFYKTDSHLAPPARLATAKALIDTLQPGLWDDSVIRDQGTRTRGTDLTRLMGLPDTEQVHSYAVERPGVTVTPKVPVVGSDQAAKPDELVLYKATGAPVISGKTVVVHDSQYEMTAGDLTPWFESLEFVQWTQIGSKGAIKALAGADRIIIETVQRLAPPRLVDELPPTLEKAIAARNG